LNGLREELDEAGHGDRLEPSDLRLLDVVLWTAGIETRGFDRNHEA